MSVLLLFREGIRYPAWFHFCLTHHTGALLARIRMLNYACMNGADQINSKKVQVAYEILRYLIKNPSAQDTLEGIVDWWFLPRPVKYQKALVKKALDMLIQDGLVIEHHGSDSRTVYKLYRRRRKK